jgi:hypothetical protein
MRSFLIAFLCASLQVQLFGEETSRTFSVDVVAGKSADEAWLMEKQGQEAVRTLLIVRGEQLRKQFSYEAEPSPALSAVVVVETGRHSFRIYLVSKGKEGRWVLRQIYDPAKLMERELKHLHQLSTKKSITQSFISTYTWMDGAHFKIGCGGVIEGTPGGNADCTITLDVKKAENPAVQIGR